MALVKEIRCDQRGCSSKVGGGGFMTLHSPGNRIVILAFNEAEYLENPEQFSVFCGAEHLMPWISSKLPTLHDFKAQLKASLAATAAPEPPINIINTPTISVIDTLEWENER